VGKGNEGDSEESGLQPCLVGATSMIARVEEEVGWRRLWDELLSFKLRHMLRLQSLSRLMSHHGRGSIL